MPITFKVNGETVTVDVAPDTPLLWVLRDALDLKGTKYGCGAAQCGACTVHLNGAPTRSCVLPVSAVQGAEVTTVEGLSPDASHPASVQASSAHEPTSMFRPACARGRATKRRGEAVREVSIEPCGRAHRGPPRRAAKGNFARAVHHEWDGGLAGAERRPTVGVRSTDSR